MKELLTSPTFVALIQGAGVGLLVILAAISQRFGHKKESTPPPSTDVVIPSVTVADRVALENMADSLRAAERAARDHREHDTEILYTLVSIKESNQRLEGLLAANKDCNQKMANLLERLVDRLPSRG